MTIITTTQKIIKIGTSKGVTIPAKQLRELGVDVGRPVRVTVEPMAEKTEIQKEYDAFKKQYGETLKNLADR